MGGTLGFLQKVCCCCVSKKESTSKNKQPIHYANNSSPAGYSDESALESFIKPNSSYNDHQQNTSNDATGNELKGHDELFVINELDEARTKSRKEIVSDESSENQYDDHHRHVPVVNKKKDLFKASGLFVLIIGRYMLLF